MLPGLARGFRRRTLVTAKLATKLGFGYLKRQLGGARDADPDEAGDAAADLVRQMGALKGLVMKFGQIASYMPGGLPPAAQRTLAKLQADTKPLAFGQIRDVIESELGDSVEALFDEFDERPFAAASIGQVHQARHEGRAVAVKVQYPGIEDVLRADLRHAKLLTLSSGIGTAIDGAALHEELTARILEECDYRREAAYQTGFCRLIGSFDGASVPAVVPERSARRVITSELVRRSAFGDFCRTASAEARSRAGATIFATSFGCIFGHCIYNADPHPGNYLVADSGDVTFLDFGCVRRYEPDIIDAWKRVARAILAHDQAGFRRYYPEMGLVPRPEKFDWDHQWNVMLYLYRPMLSKEPFTFTDAYVRESYDLLIFKNPNRRHTAMPPHWLFLNRLQWGLNSVLAALRATADWPALWRAAIDQPTRSPPSMNGSVNAAARPSARC